MSDDQRVFLADQPFNAMVERIGDPVEKRDRDIAAAAFKLRQIPLRNTRLLGKDAP